jgi:succinate dehydrogenase hydrophobic anchor subunit
VGLLFLAGIYPLLKFQANPGEQMLASVYITLGFFLVLAARKPPANRSLIAFTAWSSLVHGGTMAVQVFRDEIPRADLLRAVLPMVIVGVALIVLAPAKEKQAAS